MIPSERMHLERFDKHGACQNNVTDMPIDTDDIHVTHSASEALYYDGRRTVVKTFARVFLYCYRCLAMKTINQISKYCFQLTKSFPIHKINISVQ